MGRIEIVQHITLQQKNILDIHQLQIISAYENLICDKNIYEYFKILSANGYQFWFEAENGKFRFIGCDSKYIGHGGNQTIHEQFEWNVISVIKKILTDWHTKSQYLIYGGRYYNNPQKEEYAGITLTRKQRGVLTKILKIENKRKQLLR